MLNTPTPAEEAQEARRAEAGETCKCCGVRKSEVRVEVRRNRWEPWCLECLDEREAVIEERFSDYKKGPAA